MSSKSMPVLSKDDLRLIVESLRTQAAVFKRAANTEKDPEVRQIREKSLVKVEDLIIRVSNLDLGV